MMKIVITDSLGHISKPLAENLVEQELTCKAPCFSYSCMEENCGIEPRE